MRYRHRCHDDILNQLLGEFITVIVSHIEEWNKYFVIHSSNTVIILSIAIVTFPYRVMSTIKQYTHRLVKKHLVVNSITND